METDVWQTVASGKNAGTRPVSQSGVSPNPLFLSIYLVCLSVLTDAVLTSRFGDLGKVKHG